MCTPQEKHPLLGRKTKGSVYLLVTKLNIYWGLSHSHSGAGTVSKVEAFMMLFAELFGK